MSLHTRPTASRYDALLLEDDLEQSSMLCDLLEITNGWTCLTVPSFDVLLQFREAALSTSTAIIDVNLGFGRQSGVEAARWLRRQDYRRRVVLLTGYSEAHPLVADARSLDGVVVLRKPIDLEALCAMLKPELG